MVDVSNFGPDPEGATPLGPDDFVGLIPMWISTRSDLNQAEAFNISSAQDKFDGKSILTNEILDDFFVRALHQQMFGDVWTWAGKYRTRELSIGVPSQTVSLEVKNLMEDSKFWLDTLYPQLQDEALCRIHHRLVAIHPFPNGNGRLSRLFTDVLTGSMGRPLFTWGGGITGANSKVRSEYISALKSADRGDFDKLYEFVRSTAG